MSINQARRAPIDDRILKVLEKNAGQRRQGNSATAGSASQGQRRANPILPLLLALLPAGILFAATMIQRQRPQQAEPVRTPTIPSAQTGAKGAKDPVQKPGGKPGEAGQAKGSPTSPNGDMPKAGAAAGHSAAGTSGRSAAPASPSVSDTGNLAPTPAPRKASESVPAWGQGSTASPPPPASLLLPLPAPGNGMKDHSRLPQPSSGSLTATGPTAPLSLPFTLS